MTHEPPYNVFVSWSGARSAAVAEEFRDLIGDVVHGASVFLSRRIEPGEDYSQKIMSALDECTVGVVCLTPENLANVWMHYEVGALAKHLKDDAKICTLLLGGLSVHDLKEPLRRFQASEPIEEGIRRLLQTVSKSINGSKHRPDMLNILFEKLWPAMRISWDSLPPTNFQKLFGRANDFKIVYTELTICPELKAFLKDGSNVAKEEGDDARADMLDRLTHHYLVPADSSFVPKTLTGDPLMFRGTRTACVCEVRASGYLTQILAQSRLVRPEIVADSAIVKYDDRYKYNIVSIGALDNAMSAKVRSDPENDLIDVEVDVVEGKHVARFVEKGTHVDLIHHREEGVEFGLILSFRPQGSHNGIKWLICAGLGEYGTSGAAYYLWQHLDEIADCVPASGKFACIVRVRNGADASVHPYRLALTKEDWRKMPNTDGKASLAELCR